MEPLRIAPLLRGVGAVALVLALALPFSATSCTGPVAEVQLLDHFVSGSPEWWIAIGLCTWPIPLVFLHALRLPAAVVALLIGVEVALLSRSFEFLLGVTLFERTLWGAHVAMFAWLLIAVSCLLSAIRFFRLLLLGELFQRPAKAAA